MESPITFQELSEAVGQMALGRAPGIDGLPVDFFKRFWRKLGPDWFEVLCERLGAGELPLSCRRAVLTLLPKKEDLSELKNWRPVALLCMDFKIFSKSLANRLKVHLETLVHRDQSYCVPGRSILDNLHLLRDTMDLAALTEMNFGLLGIDQEKAFDRVDHSYLFKTLRAFGFGEGFIAGVKVLYAGATCLVKVAGGLCRPLQVGQGIWQGCPLSGLLYTIAFEPLLVSIRSRVQGIVGREMGFKSPVVG